MYFQQYKKILGGFHAWKAHSTQQVSEKGAPRNLTLDALEELLTNPWSVATCPISADEEEGEEDGMLSLAAFEANAAYTILATRSLLSPAIDDPALSMTLAFRFVPLWHDLGSAQQCRGLDFGDSGAFRNFWFELGATAEVSVRNSTWRFGMDQGTVPRRALVYPTLKDCDNKCARGLIDEAVKLLCEIWSAPNILFPVSVLPLLPVVPATPRRSSLRRPHEVRSGDATATNFGDAPNLLGNTYFKPSARVFRSLCAKPNPANADQENPGSNQGLHFLAGGANIELCVTP
ncbi:hypothetical protein B0H11DRAFT_2232256 [Mycena galericulata]|nr:hypothetical protein B0H11DRAFT_2232256 [Mycena galericulata]